MIRVLFCGARKLGMDCLQAVMLRDDVELVGAVVPPRKGGHVLNDINEREFLQRIGVLRIPWNDIGKLEGVDLVFSVLNSHIFRRDHIAAARLGIINLHPAPLPQFRGRNGNTHAIASGAELFGAALHYVDEGIDTGPIIGSASFNIASRETAETLYHRTQIVAKRIFLDELPKILNAAATGKKTKSIAQLDGKAHYYHAESIGTKQVELSWTFTKLCAVVRSLHFPPFEPAYFIHDSRKFYLTYDNDQIVMSDRWAI